MDGIDFTYGNKVRLNAFYGKPTNATNLKVNGQKPDKYYWGVNAAADLGKAVTLFAGYDEVKSKGTAAKEAGKDKIFDVGANFKFAKDANFEATYLHAKLDGKVQDAPNNGFILGLGYGGAKATKVGSWGIGVKYYHLPAGGFIHPGYEWITSPYANGTVDGVYNDAYDMYRRGAKGWWAGAKYTVAKNMIFDVEYMQLKNRVGDEVKNKTWLTSLTVSF